MGNPRVGRGKVYPTASEDHCSTLPCVEVNARLQCLVVKVKHYPSAAPVASTVLLVQDQTPQLQLRRRQPGGNCTTSAGLQHNHPSPRQWSLRVLCVPCSIKWEEMGFFTPVFPSCTCSPWEERGWVGVWHLV